MPEGLSHQHPIPQVIKLPKDNKLDEAGWMLFENNPLTTVCALICNHEKQCEGHCVLGKKGAPVHFSVIEQYISSTYATKMVKGPAPSNGMKVAIVGSGPAGITIAILMARKGYQVTIFENKDKIGGAIGAGIFASGDVVQGARTVVEAVAYSKQVAEAMHEYILQTEHSAE